MNSGQFITHCFEFIKYFFQLIINSAEKNRRWIAHIKVLIKI